MSPSAASATEPRRCAWAGAAPDYRRYHDEEWGRPRLSDPELLERLTLEAFQSGLSWLTILRKRENFRAAFAGFRIAEVATFDERDVERMLGDAGIVRHRGKIEAAINNAHAALEVQSDVGSLHELIWSYEPTRRGRPVPVVLGDVAAKTPESIALSKDLLKRGFRFVGPTTAYAAMQSLGLVNDHLKGCHVRAACERDRKALTA